MGKRPVNSEEYADYRRNQIKAGLLYQDFVVDLFMSALGMAVTCYSSKEYQQTVGETRQGIEIKNDQRHPISGYLWIELAEKAVPRPGSYATSGIHRDDNSWLYVIGNYDTVWVFSKRLLRILEKTDRYRVLENNFGTSVGYLLPVDDADKYACIILHPQKSDVVARLSDDLHQIGQELQAALLKDKKQHTLF